MIISQYEHKNAVNKIIEALPEACKKDPEVSKFLNELSLSVNPHYCVGYMRYIEDGIYDFAQEPMEFKTKEEALKYIEEEFDIEHTYPMTSRFFSWSYTQKLYTGMFPQKEV